MCWRRGKDAGADVDGQIWCGYWDVLCMADVSRLA